MAATAEVAVTSPLEMDAVKPTVYIAGEIVPFAQCAAIERSAGLTPGRAMLTIGGAGYDVGTVITLNAASWGRIKPYARVKITYDGGTLFLGYLVRRHDGGADNVVTWEAWDDRWLLSKIPVRGALVYDKADGGTVKFLSGYRAVFNAGNTRNCIYATVGSLGKVPVFTPLGDAGDDTVASLKATDDESAPTSGASCSWTPKRALHYLWACTQLAAGGVPGTDDGFWRSLAGSTALTWDLDSLNLVSFGLDHVMCETSVRGKSMLNAIATVADQARDVGFKTACGTDSSRIVFYNRNALGTVTSDLGTGDPTTTGVEIKLARGGDIDDIDTAYDFELFEDATPVAPTVLVEAARPKIELPVQYETTVTLSGKTPTGYTDEATNSLEPAWTFNEERSFLNGIAGNNNGSRQKYAIFPRVLGHTDVLSLSNGYLADGNNGTPIIMAGTPEAVALLRACYPRVFSAYRIRSERIAAEMRNLTLADGTKPFENAPILYDVRKPLATQLQYLFSLDGQRLKLRWPVRVQVYGANDNDWRDVTYSNGLEITDDGLIYLHGLTDLAGVPEERVYERALDYGCLECYRRDVRLNIAIPLDQRVFGTYSVESTEIDTGVYSEIGGSFIDYIDNPEGYRVEVQSGSFPGPFTDYANSLGGYDSVGTAGLTRVLRDETAGATRHARQRAATSAYVRRHSSWKLIGIRPEYDVGYWVTRIRVRGGPPGDLDYEIYAPIEVMTLDFMEQITCIGGLISQLKQTLEPVQRADVPAGPEAAATLNQLEAGEIKSTAKEYSYGSVWAV